MECTLGLYILPRNPYLFLIVRARSEKIPDLSLKQRVILSSEIMSNIEPKQTPDTELDS